MSVQGDSNDGVARTSHAAVKSTFLQAGLPTGQRPVFKITHRSILAFSALQGRHVAPTGLKFDGL